MASLLQRLEELFGGNPAVPGQGSISPTLGFEGMSIPSMDQVDQRVNEFISDGVDSLEITRKARDIANPIIPYIERINDDPLGSFQDAVTSLAPFLNPDPVPQGPTEVTQKPINERTLEDQANAHREAVMHAESALRGEVQPDKEHTLEVLMAATEARGGDTPMSVEQKEETRSGLSKLIDRMNKSDRIDLLAAGLSIMQNADKGTSTGAAIAGGLLSGMQEATRNRIEKARMAIAERQVSASEMNARANQTRADALAQRTAQAPMAALIKSMNKAATAEQKAQGMAILQQMAPNASEAEIETLRGFAEQAVRDVQNSGGDMRMVGPIIIKKAVEAGIPLEEDTSFFGLMEGEGLRVGDESPLSSLTDLLP